MFLKTYDFSDKLVTYSVVVPIYNQEDIIVENIQSIFDMTEGNYELICILDFCFDKTEERLLQFLDTHTTLPVNLQKITLFKNKDVPLFETKCDNIGFKHAKGIYCLEIQADMKMTEKGYNLQLVKPFQLLNNVIAVSGRCAHNLFRGGGVGKLGEDIEKTVSTLGVPRNRFYVYDTCNRGPLMLDRKKLEEMNFLDEENYFLDDSDHDLMLRAYIQKGYICGYVPIDFSAPIKNGSTRNSKTYDFCEEFLVNQRERERLYKTMTNGLQKYKDIWKGKPFVGYCL